MNEITERIKARRKELNLTMSDISKATGVSVAAVSKWENGAIPAFDYAPKIAQSLNVSLKWLAHGGDEYGDAYKPKQISIIGNTQTGPDSKWFDLGCPCEYGDEYVDFPVNGKNVYALIVVDNSLSPRVLPGEALLIDPDAELACGEDIILKLKDGTFIIKQLAAIRNNTIFLDSYDNGYTRLTFNQSEVDFLHQIIGVARSSRIKQHDFSTKVNK